VSIGLDLTNHSCFLCCSSLNKITADLSLIAFQFQTLDSTVGIPIPSLLHRWCDLWSNIQRDSVFFSPVYLILEGKWTFSSDSVVAVASRLFLCRPELRNLDFFSVKNLRRF